MVGGSGSAGTTHRLCLGWSSDSSGLGCRIKETCRV